MIFGKILVIYKVVYKEPESEVKRYKISEPGETTSTTFPFFVDEGVDFTPIPWLPKENS